jgi:hypothetical protein
MKKIFWVAALVPFFAFQCKKDPFGKCLKGKVIRISCASYVVQVLNDNSVGEDQWKDLSAGEQKVYDDVFTASDKCKIPVSYKAGDIIYFNLETPNPDDCILCTMYDAPPQKKFKIKNISSVPCE